MDSFRKASQEDKLTHIMMAINTMNTNHELKIASVKMAMLQKEDGIFPRLRDVENDVEKLETAMTDLESSNEEIAEVFQQMKGIIQVQDRKITALQRQVDELKARSMGKNVVISRILGDNDEEDVRDKVFEFCKTKLKRETTKGEIVKAHRLRKKENGRVRLIVAKCTNEFRGEIFGYTKNLKDVKNNKDQYFYVDPQLPEAMAAERKSLNVAFKRAKKRN